MLIKLIKVCIQLFRKLLPPNSLLSMNNSWAGVYFLYNQTLHVIVQGECVSHFFAGFESQLTPKYILLFNQSFYVKVRIYHRASNIMPLHPHCCSHRFKTGVFLCMFERGSIMSYVIYHAVWILQCSLFWPWILVSSTLCCYLDCLMYINRIKLF